MARKNLPTTTIAPQTQNAPQPDAKPALNLYSGNIMRIKPETGYVLVMLRNANGKEVEEKPVCFWLEDHTDLLDTLKVRVGDNVAILGEAIIATDMVLPNDKTPVSKVYNAKPESFSIVRRKIEKVALVTKGDGEPASPGIAKRLLELGAMLGLKLGK